MVTVVGETTRICKICGIEKPIDDFPKIHEYRGRSCKKCYYTRHKDSIAEYGKLYYVENRESEIEKAKQRYLKNRDELLLKLHNRRFSEEFIELYKQREKEGSERKRKINLETYGTACSPEFTAYMRTLQRQKRAVNKRTTGYVYPLELREKRKLHYLDLRKQALEYYGGKCECCGESRYEMLTFDHIQGNGHNTDKRGVKLVYDAIKEYKEQGYPNEKYRILCWNCNTARGFYGYCPHNRKLDKGAKITQSKKRKLEVIEAYGGKCVLCGETHWEFLTIDHINGGGSEHRRNIGATTIYIWLKKQGYPQKEYRLLCANCNCSDKRNKWTREVR